MKIMQETKLQAKVGSYILLCIIGVTLVAINGVVRESTFSGASARIRDNE